MTQTHAYIRISTDRQETKSQRQQLDGWSTAHDQPITHWHEDTKSGITRWQERALAECLAECATGDTIVVSEISRIARSTVGVLTFLEQAAERGLIVIIVQQNMTIDASLNSKIFVVVLALAAEIERALLSERTKAGIARRKQTGLPVGRQRGSRIASKLDQRADEIKLLLDAKVSVRAIARVLDCASQTLANWLKTPRPPNGDAETLPLPGVPAPAPLVTRTNRQQQQITP